MNKKVEAILTKKPIVMLSGMGLSSEFHQIFDEFTPAQKAKLKQQRLYENMSNMQIKINEKFQSPARSKKKAEK